MRSLPAPFPRSFAAVTLAAALFGSTLTSGSAAPGRDQPRGNDGSRLESADWVPFRGRVRISRTWGHRGGHAYPAIDFEVPAGTSVAVYAAGPGTVIAAHGSCPDTTADGAHKECNEGKGNFVEIAHPDGRRSRYFHLRHGSVRVQAGDHACRGCRIGRTGWSGNVSPPGPRGGHLHYEELDSFVTVNPGRMRARHPSGRVSYPGRRSWMRVGKRGLTVRNARFPKPGPEPVDCLGWAATRLGTPGDDEIRGTAGPDIIAGSGGNDAIYGFESDDRLCGGAGDDLLVGGTGQDSIDGGDGWDSCFQDEEDGFQQSSGELIACEGASYRLAVSVGCCFRFVTSEPPGISCPPDCSEIYPPNQRVVLRLSSGSSYWDGCEPYEGSRFGPDCTVVMTQPRLVRVQ